LTRQNDGADLGERPMWLLRPVGEGDDAVMDDEDDAG
jgi:hypothetical protein